MTVPIPPRELLQALLSAAPMPMLVGTVDGDLRPVAVNRRFTELLGYCADDIGAEGGRWWSLAFPDEAYRCQLREAWRAAIVRAATPDREAAQPIDARVACRDGSVRHVEFHLGLYAGLVFALCNDVTKRRQAEVELTEARGFLQRVLDTSPSMVFVTDEMGRLVFVNRYMASYYETTPEAMMSRATEDVHANVVQAEGFVIDDALVIRTGKELVKEELNTAPSGQIHWFHTVKVPLFRSDGRVLCLGIATDITARRRAEEAKLELEAQMRQSQKLESLGVLAGGIAHDFNNLLTAIQTNAHLADARLAEDSPARHYIHGIELAVRRAAQLTQQMLAYVGRGRAVIQSLRLDKVVAEMNTLLEAVVSKKATFRLKLEPALVEADAAQMHQVIMNLIVNASDALGDSPGRIEITTGTRELESEELHSAFLDETPPAGRYAFVEVDDDGCGMAEETLSRIFEPFFSTKFTGRGLGLSAVLGIVRAHRGTVQVATRLGEGTRFVVLLPHSSAPESVALAAAFGAQLEARGTVLVVDDEEYVRSAVCTALRDAGFKVLSASDGQAGVELFQSHAEEIGAVLLDLTMPRLDGWQCLQRMRTLRKDIPALLMSGYAAEHSMPESIVPAPAFLLKPFRSEELVRATAGLIAHSPSPGGSSRSG